MAMLLKKEVTGILPFPTILTHLLSSLFPLLSREDARSQYENKDETKQANFRSCLYPDNCLTEIKDPRV